jgi:hypothetical protein
MVTRVKGDLEKLGAKAKTLGSQRAWAESSWLATSWPQPLGLVQKARRRCLLNRTTSPLALFPSPHHRRTHPTPCNMPNRPQRSTALFTPPVFRPRPKYTPSADSAPVYHDHTMENGRRYRGHKDEFPWPNDDEALSSYSSLNTA